MNICAQGRGRLQIGIVGAALDRKGLGELGRFTDDPPVVAAQAQDGLVLTRPVAKIGVPGADTGFSIQDMPLSINEPPSVTDGCTDLLVVGAELIAVQGYVPEYVIRLVQRVIALPGDAVRLGRGDAGCGRLDGKSAELVAPRIVVPPEIEVAVEALAV